MSLSTSLIGVKALYSCSVNMYCIIYSFLNCYTQILESFKNLQG
nr:MAG TPA: hypothetical protein [Caudoviricetes sp.]